jgi:di/tricarboxylate transporter
MSDQNIIFSIIVGIFIVFIHGKIRYDAVAFAALVIAGLLGVVPIKELFSGFGHPAVIIVALVLVISRGLIYSGAVELITQQLSKYIKGITSHIAIMGGAAAMLSSIINNIAALAILMPADLNLAKKANRSPAKTLMPLSFASILGGMVTMIGTAPNVVIATFREDTFGTAYTKFDFAYVGLITAIAGVLFISVFGHKLIPHSSTKKTPSQSLSETKYVTNARIPKDSDMIGQNLFDISNLGDKSDIAIMGIIRDDELMHGSIMKLQIKAGDLLVVEGVVSNIDLFIDKNNLVSIAAGEIELEAASKSLFEVVVTSESWIVGKTSRSLGLKNKHHASLLGISRNGENITTNVRKTPIKPGDLLLIHGNIDEMTDLIEWMECLTLSKRGLEIPSRKKAWLSIAIFIASIVLSTLDMVYLPLALSAVIMIYLALGIIPLKVVYKSISWPIIILLAAMIPIGNALTTTGGANTIAMFLVEATQGFSPILILVIILVVTMTLSDVLNNVATVLILAPISVTMAAQIGVNPDPFLMAVAVGASCAFLTPIGHQNNSLILGPGGYKFSDYWKLGLPLEIVVTMVSIPAILFFWPLH